MRKKYLKMILENLKYWLAINIIFTIFFGLEPLLNIFLVKNIVNGLQSFVSEDNFNKIQIIFSIIILFLVTVIQMLANNYQLYLDNKYEAKINYILEKNIIKKSIDVPYLFFENIAFQDHLNRVTINMGTKFMTPVKGILNISQKVISFISILVYIFSYSKISALILFMLIPILFVNIRLGKAKFEMTIFQTPIAREMSYLNSLLLKRNMAMEIRLFKLGNYFTRRWSRLYWSVNKQVIKLNQKLTIQNSILSIMTTTLFSLIILQSAILVFLKKNSLGGFVAVFQSLNTVQESLFSLSSDIVWVYTDFLYISDYFNFIDFEDKTAYIETKKIGVPIPEVTSNPIVEFSNVSFNYPYSNQNVLKNISFSIKKGEKVAIVGENGSGKTTIIKCLMKLAHSNVGEVSVNGINLKDIDTNSLMDFISVIPQNYAKYNLTIKDNIVLNQQFDKNKFNNIVESTGINKLANKLDEGYNTYLGKEFIAGEDLSGGQWQSIAISRARYKDSNILIMDEPTSALDFKTEEKLYKELIESSNNKTVIYISHRTSFTRLADKIVVLKNGSIAEIGNHEDLMRNKNVYYEMFTTQARRYN